jgi:CheY-like chemotaxis protein
VEATADLLAAISTLLWPIAIVILILWLRPHVMALLKDRDFSIEVAGTKISVQRASDELSRSIEDLRSQLVALKEAQRDQPSPARVIRSVLWVDDRRDANVFEIASMRRRGVVVEQADNTVAAVERLSLGGIDLVISDMGREEAGRRNPRAGLDLLEQTGTDRPPVLFYTGSVTPELRRQVADLGGFGITTSPTKLFELIDRIGKLPSATRE